MVPFHYRRATSVQDAITQAASGACFLAGGTTLLDLMREQIERPERIVDINGIGFDRVGLEVDRLVIGALARMADVAADPITVSHQPLIVQALLEGASPQLRNMATIGGNLMQRVRCAYFRQPDAACNKRAPASGCAALDGEQGPHAIFGTSEQCIAAHPSDLAVALLALDAGLRVQGPAGERRLPLEQLYRLPGNAPHLEHTLAPGELITAVEVPLTPRSQHARYVKVRSRAAYEFALVSAAVALQVEDGIVQSARIAAGGVGTCPWRLRECEAMLVGRPARHASWLQAAERSIEGARPAAGVAYKVGLLSRTLVRALELAAEQTS